MLAVVGAVVGLVATSIPAGASSRPAAFTGAWWVPSTERDAAGCATAHGYPANWAIQTGKGADRDTASAATCAAYRGGLGVDSSAIVSSSISVNVPLSGLNASLGGLNVSWNVSYARSVQANATNLSQPCPLTIWNYSGFYNYTTIVAGYTYWINETEITGSCDVDALTSLSMAAALVDLTSGSTESAPVFVNTTWAGVEHYVDWVYEAQRFTNASFYSYNYTYSISNNWTDSAASASDAGFWNPSFAFNNAGGSWFASNDSYALEMSWSVLVEATVWGFAGGHASGSFNVGGTAHHIDLRPLVFW